MTRKRTQPPPSVRWAGIWQRFGARLPLVLGWPDMTRTRSFRSRGWSVHRPFIGRSCVTGTLEKNAHDRPARRGYRGEPWPSRQSLRPTSSPGCSSSTLVRSSTSTASAAGVCGRWRSGRRTLPAMDSIQRRSGWGRDSNQAPGRPAGRARSSNRRPARALPSNVPRAARRRHSAGRSPRETLPVTSRTGSVLVSSRARRWRSWDRRGILGLVREPVQFRRHPERHWRARDAASR